MYNGIDAVDVDKQPNKNHSKAKAIYFIAFLLVISFFVLNMFVGVVVENFHKCRAEQEIEEETRKQKKRQIILEKQERLKNEPVYYANFPRWRRILHDICVNKYFDIAVVIVIGFNIITMSIEHYQMSSVSKQESQQYTYLLY